MSIVLILVLLSLTVSEMPPKQKPTQRAPPASRVGDTPDKEGGSPDADLGKSKTAPQDVGGDAEVFSEVEDGQVKELDDPADDEAHVPEIVVAGVASTLRH